MNRKLNLPTDQRMALLRNLVTSFLETGRVETTLTRAKEASRLAEKMITLGKTNTLHSRRQALEFITKEDVVTKLFEEIAPGYEDRNGGYTRIMKLGNRKGDNAPIVIMELVTEPCTPKAKKAAPAPKKAAAPKKVEAVEETAAEETAE